MPMPSSLSVGTISSCGFAGRRSAYRAVIAKHEIMEAHYECTEGMLMKCKLACRTMLLHAASVCPGCTQIHLGDRNLGQMWHLNIARPEAPLQLAGADRVHSMCPPDLF